MGADDDCEDVQISGSDASERIMRAANLIRGSIITSFADVEFMYAEFYFRSLRIDEYSSLPVKLPRKIDDRAKAVKRIAALPGPINVFRDQIVAEVDDVLQFEQLRHFMAHAVMFIRGTDQHTSPVVFRMFDNRKGGVAAGQWITTVDQLADASVQVGRVAVSIATLFLRIFNDLELPPIPFSE